MSFDKEGNTQLSECGDGQYQCLNGGCIDASGVCNDVAECPGGEDELNCN